MEASTPSAPLTDIEYLSRSEHRVATLSALAERPRSRTELRGLAEVSRSTTRRTLRAFEDRNWVRRDGQQYEATQLGAFVAASMEALVDRLETERALRDVWHLLPTDADGFTVWLWSDAVVDTAEPADPYRPVNRFLSLLRSADRVRFAGIDRALLEPCLDELCQQSLGGTDAEIIVSADALDYLRSTDAAQPAAAVDSGALAVRSHDDVPAYGVGSVDDRAVLAATDPDSGTVRVLLDTDTPGARDWGDRRYRTLRSESVPLGIEQSTA